MKLGESATKQECAQRLADLLDGRARTGDELEAGAQLIVTEPTAPKCFGLR
jgi:hypothetical protein